MTVELPLGPSVLNIHTPNSSFAIQHSFMQDTLTDLWDKLSRKVNTGAKGERIGPGWLKYEWNDNVWNLDDESDYSIFVWRQKSDALEKHMPTLYLHNPRSSYPTPPEYINPSFYAFRRNSSPVASGSSRGGRSIKSVKLRRNSNVNGQGDIPQHKADFIKFHSENGVRTVTGSIGPVQNVRMLLKTGYRHVYVSRTFALKHGFVPVDATPGFYGYGGLVNIGQWPITVGKTKTMHTVFLSEETHFDCILGRSFMERRGVKTDPTDPTNINCMDTGEKIDCELVVIRDGKGEIVTVT